MNMASPFSPVAAWQSNGIYEYLLVGHPDAAVSNKIMAEKERLLNGYREPVAGKFKPYITVANFMANEGMESTIIKWIQRICGAQHSFAVAFNKYSGVPPHSICLRVEDPVPFQQLAKELETVDDFIRASACPPATLVSRPQLSIARSLPEPVYTKAMAEYAEKTFQGSFMLAEFICCGVATSLIPAPAFRYSGLNRLLKNFLVMWPEKSAHSFQSKSKNMKPSALTLPGYKVNEYRLVLNPHEELRNKIKEVKKEFYDVYNAPGAIGGKAHIALVSFLQYAMMEERIINRLKTVAMGFHPFKVELKDFGSFPSHTIFINVTTKEPVRNLVKEIKPFQQLLKLNNDNKAHFIDEPHLAVARKLVPWQYEKGWLEYSQKHFTGRFVADSMLLLRRQAGTVDQPYQILQRLEFMNLPVTTRQGELFG